MSPEEYIYQFLSSGDPQIHTQSMTYHGLDLYQTVLAHRAQIVVEFGTGDGVSTRCLAAACQATGGHLFSVDLHDKPQVKQAVDHAGLSDYCTFYTGNTLDFPVMDMDILFIDDDHQYEQVWRELTQFANRVKKAILFHEWDTVGVKRAIYDYLKESHLSFHSMIVNSQSVQLMTLHLVAPLC